MRPGLTSSCDMKVSWWNGVVCFHPISAAASMTPLACAITKQILRLGERSVNLADEASQADNFRESPEIDGSPGAAAQTHAVLRRSGFDISRWLDTAPARQRPRLWTGASAHHRTNLEDLIRQ